MSRYRKKPVVIEAWQWFADAGSQEPPSWALDALGRWPATGGIKAEPHHPQGHRLAIATLEGVMIAQPGDWIIQGVKGELYPCKPDIFAATYEPAEPTPNSDSNSAPPIEETTP